MLLPRGCRYLGLFWAISVIELLLTLMFMGHLTGCFYYMFGGHEIWRTPQERFLIQEGLMDTWVNIHFGGYYKVEVSLGGRKGKGKGSMVVGGCRRGEGGGWAGEGTAAPLFLRPPLSLSPSLSLSLTHTHARAHTHTHTHLAPHLPRSSPRSTLPATPPCPPARSTRTQSRGTGLPARTDMPLRAAPTANTRHSAASPSTASHTGEPVASRFEPQGLHAVGWMPPLNPQGFVPLCNGERERGR
jgi:hypothetical protein